MNTTNEQLAMSDMYKVRAEFEAYLSTKPEWLLEFMVHRRWLERIVLGAFAAGLQQAEQREPFTPRQRKRLWDNSPEHHTDAASFAAFERLVKLTERAHGIGADHKEG